MIRNNECKCCNAYDFVYTVADVSDPVFAGASVQSIQESNIMVDLKDIGAFNTDCKSPVLDNDVG